MEMNKVSLSRASSYDDDDEVEKVGATTRTETVTFNVGGKIHQTSRSLIVNYQDGDTMLARLISDTWNKNNDQSDGAAASVFIDRDGERFRYVLDFMRYGRLVLPYNVSKDLLLLDLDFYGIHHLDGHVDESNTTLENDDEGGKIRYGDAPMGQEFAFKLKAEYEQLDTMHKEIGAKMNDVKERLFLLRYASLCFGSLTHQYTPVPKTSESLVRLGVGHWKEGTDPQILDLLLRKVRNKKSKEYDFLQKCLELYGLRLRKFIYTDWSGIEAEILKPFDETTKSLI